MTEFARDVAKELDRRQRRRKWLVRGALVAAIVAAVIYLRCGAGWGLGGSGSGSGSGPGAPLADAGPHRCAIRVAAAGITVAGKPASREEAVAQCAGTDGAEIVVTGDAREGDWEQLRTALDTAHIPIVLHGTRSPDDARR